MQPGQHSPAEAPLFEALLLDLDGTLVDTAPDMVSVLDRLCIEEGVAPVPYAMARNQISRGVYALLRAAFGELGELGEPRYQQLRERFLTIYAGTLAQRSRLFEGYAELLEELEQRAIPWGVVTNKPGAYTTPLLQQLGLHARAACVVSGDSAPQPKPSPAPLLMALDALQLRPGACLYVGDAEIDIQAGRAAGMYTVAASWGYIEHPEQIAGWDAHAVIETPAQLRRWLIAETA